MLRPDHNRSLGAVDMAEIPGLADKDRLAAPDATLEPAFTRGAIPLRKVR